MSLLVADKLFLQTITDRQINVILSMCIVVKHRVFVWSNSFCLDYLHMAVHIQCSIFEVFFFEKNSSFDGHSSYMISKTMSRQ